VNKSQAVSSTANQVQVQQQQQTQQIQERQAADRQTVQSSRQTAAGNNAFAQQQLQSRNGFGGGFGGGGFGGGFGNAGAASPGAPRAGLGAPATNPQGFTPEQSRSFDLNGDGRVAPRELNDARDYFDRAGNNNGVVDGAERGEVQKFIDNNGSVNDINRSTSERLRSQMQGDVNDWARKSGDNIQQQYSNSLDAGDRYMRFAERSSSSAALDLAEKAIGASPAHMGTKLATSLGKDVLTKAKYGLWGFDETKAKSAMGKELEAKTEASKGKINDRRDALMKKIEAAGDNPEKLRALQGEVSGLREPPVKSSDAIMRDMLLQHARSEGNNSRGSHWHQRELGSFYHSYDLGMPWGIDSHDIAGELNKLDRSVRYETRIND
jgi:hypothetical protein